MNYRMTFRPLAGTRVRIPGKTDLEGYVADVIRCEVSWVFLVTLDDGRFIEVRATDCALVLPPDGSPYRS